MINTYETRATYGSRQTPCTVFVVEVNGEHWYAIEGSQNVNCSPCEIEPGQDLELIEDSDCFTSDEGIEDLAHLEREVLDYLGMNDEDESEEPRFNSLTIEVTEFGHQAMVDDYNGEVARMLRELAARVEENGLMNVDGVYLRDSNGNTVGTVSIDSND